MKLTSEHAHCAKAIKAELKKLFPKTKFSVTSESYSGGDSVRISWIDGVTEERVHNIVKKYQAGSFDGMTDSYTYDNRDSNLPQAKYVHTQRHYSAKISR